MKNRTGTPSKNEIYNYWKDKIKYKKISQINIGFKVTDICFACNHCLATERCHILPLALNGNNETSNIHLLCFECHYESENLFGESYWYWFKLKNISNSGSFLRVKNKIQLVKQLFKNKLYSVINKIYSTGVIDDYTNIKDLERIVIQDEKNIRRHTKIALQSIKAKGKKLGTPKNLTKDAQKKAVAIIKNNAANNQNNIIAKEFIYACLKKGFSYTKILLELNEKNIKTSRGKDFTQIVQVQRLANLIKKTDNLFDN